MPAQKAGLFTAFGGMGATASVIPAAIPLEAHKLDSPVSDYLGAVPALFFGLLVGVLLASFLLRVMTAAGILSAGSALQGSALLGAAVAADGSAFIGAAAVAGLGFGLCEASGSLVARVIAGERTSGLLSALTGTVALIAALAPLVIVAELLGGTPGPLLLTVSFVHFATAALFFFSRTIGAESETDPSAYLTGTSRRALSLLVAPVSAALFLYVGVETIFAGWSAVIPGEILALDAAAAAAGTSVFWGLMAAGRYTTWFILKTKIGPPVVLTSTCAVASASFAIAGWIRDAHPEAALGIAAVAIACLGSVYSLVLGIGLSRVKVQDAKKAVGLMVACGAAGGACIPTAVLTFTPHPGSAVVFFCAAALTAAVVVLVAGPGARGTSRSGVLLNR